MKHAPIDDLLRLIAEGTAGVTGGAFCHALVRHLALALDMRYAFIAEFAAGNTHVRTLAFWYGERFLDDFDYDFHGTPCQAVLLAAGPGRISYPFSCAFGCLLSGSQAKRPFLAKIKPIGSTPEVWQAQLPALSTSAPAPPETPPRRSPAAPALQRRRSSSR